jgi:poly(3-hydroxybutyrate) depolymerase
MIKSLARFFILLLVTHAALQFSGYSQQLETIRLTSGLAVSLPKGYRGRVTTPNSIEADLASGHWKVPVEGQIVTFPDEENLPWRTVVVDSTGWFTDTVLSRCYVYCNVEMEGNASLLLEAMGDEMVYVNGAPRSGNPYGLSDSWESWQPHFDFSLLPVSLHSGSNDLLFRCSRGALKATLCLPAKPIVFNAKDVTVPDFVVGEAVDAWGSIVVINTTAIVLDDLLIRSTINGIEGEPIAVPIIQPMSVRKVAFRLLSNSCGEEEVARVAISLLKHEKENLIVIDTVTIPVRAVSRWANRKETFISSIDGSVQYYGILPASDTIGPKALFLSLHGAGVEAINQSGSYFPKTWGHIVAPTNRRPYGFDWEDWGRLDALEAMDVVKHRYAIDESRIYLTGHSMGGHGVWHLGSLYSDRFGAIGPSAGWISFRSYAFGGGSPIDTTPMEQMIHRSTTPSEPLQHIGNYRQLGVYVLHGADDDNVPVEQARSMVEQLSKVHTDFVYHEQPGVGHWWDVSPEPGADCVDWQPMFDFFARHARPGKRRIRAIDFCTANPAVSATNNWLTIDAQQHQLEMSSVSVRFDPGLNRFVGTTDNVARLAFDLDVVERLDTLSVELDSQKVIVSNWSWEQKQLWLEQVDGKWSVTSAPSPGLKGAHRYGTWKEVFRNKVVFVYGTKGTREENRWAFDKARYDTEKLWYQGNGSIDVIADVDFNPMSDPDRNVVLYGNSATNAAWKSLLVDSPVQVAKGLIKVGDRRFSGDDVCCVFVRPRAGSPNAMVGAVAGTGVHGMRLSNQLPYLSPWIGLPDCNVMNSNVLSKGEDGILTAGFFGLDWSVGRGDFVWENQ